MIELLFCGRLGLDAAVENESIRLRIAVNNTRVIEGERLERLQGLCEWATAFLMLFFSYCEEVRARCKCMGQFVADVRLGSF